ncbi:Unknown protein sequence [Pseudomonas coronafaciens pv. oryzae]|nr:Unknown protein sequence [Pseudomonas coronafaciens pv. oryzae]KPY06900.1 Unknown protein sequence [Pseudomonas coronafaciens pv. oryzae]RMM37918.1 hypothetical protein ALQ80_00483 [Pseudomonas coronafaciens pv. oryzae]RMS99684.1 hypothetical protein ALP55_03357 [Pseudomonas coronafaciens pv. oryzae]
MLLSSGIALMPLTARFSTCAGTLTADFCELYPAIQWDFSCSKVR